MLKQSLPYVRTDPTWPMTRERSSREAGVLAAHQNVDPAHVPALLHYDAPNYVLALEDLSDHEVWRTVLNSRVSDEGSPDDVFAAQSLGEYVARVSFGTSVLGLGSAAHKAAVGAAINPELCEITEDLVLTEPFVDHRHNVVHPDNVADVTELAGDPDVLHAAGLAKLGFMTRAESLLHGDLHTGSVFVRFGDAPSTRAFDSEFGFYGPIGFDLGMLWGNYVLAAARAVAQKQPRRAVALLDLGRVSWTAFETEYRALWPRRQDPRVYPEPVLTSLLAQVWADAVTYAGAEVARRVIGFAKAADIESLPDAHRVVAARGALRAARTLLVHTLHGGIRPLPDALIELTAEPLGL